MFSEVLEACSCAIAVLQVGSVFFRDLRRRLHHLADDDDLRPQLAVDGEDVDEPECEHHVIHTQKGPACIEPRGKHPATHTHGFTHRDAHTLSLTHGRTPFGVFNFVCVCMWQ